MAASFQYTEQNVIIDYYIKICYNMHMTLEMKTLEGGVIDVGFWGGDITKIQLGELPPMTTQQFAGYAAMLLVDDIIPNYDPMDRLDWAIESKAINADLEITPQLELTGKFLAQDTDELASQLFKVPDRDLDELIIVLQAAVTPVDEPEYYAESPFSITSDGNVSMELGEDRHTVKAREFHALTNYVLHGGMMGWGYSGTYDEVRDAANKISEALNTE